MKIIIRCFTAVIMLFLLNSLLFAQIHNEKSTAEISADDIMYHIMLLSSDQLKGRRAGTDEGRIAAAYIANEFERYGLSPGGELGSYFQVFEFISGVSATQNNNLVVMSGESQFSYRLNEDFMPLGFSGAARVTGEIVFAGFGISAEELQYDDYDGIDVEDKVVVVFMYSPGIAGADSGLARHEPVRFKAMTARQKGAAALLICNGYSEGVIDDLPEMKYEQASGDAGIPVVRIRRNILEKLFEGTGENPKDIEAAIHSTGKPASLLLTGKRVTVKTEILYEKSRTQNVVAYIEGGQSPVGGRVVIIGAHYDHLGLGGSGSMAPSQVGEVHNGADDNASGVAGLLELAEKFADSDHRPDQTVVFIAFGAEELGLLGSGHYIGNPVFPLESTNFMINFDMIGRMTGNKLILNGTGSSPVWHGIAGKVNENFNLELIFSDGGLGGSDHMPFYTNEIPVVFFFTGTHSDYHKPSDDYELINSIGEEKIVAFAESIIREIDEMPEKLVYTRAQEAGGGRPGSEFRVTLGVVPDLAYEENDGFRITDVVDGGPAAAAGMKSGDLIIKMAGKDIKNIYDYMYVLGILKPGQETEVVIKRDDGEITLKVTMRRR